MPGPRRTPWIAIDVDIRKDDRVADLPSDAARWGYVAGVLAEARLQDPRGVFGSKATFEEAVGRFSRHLEAYIAAGLMERATSMCTDCRHDYGDLKRGALVVHNWIRKQRDPTAADRQNRRRHVTDEGSEPPPVPPRSPRNGRATEGATVTAMSRDSHADVTALSRQRHGNVTGASRARGETQTQTLDTDTEESLGSPGVTPGAQPSARSSVFDIEPDQPEYPVAQLLATRFRYRGVSEAQWERLHEIVDNEYPAGTSKGSDRYAAWRWLAQLMNGLSRDDGDPIGAAFREVNRRIGDRLGQRRTVTS